MVLMDYLSSGDGIFTALKVLELINSTKNWRLASFKKFPQKIILIPTSSKKKFSERKISAIVREHKKLIKKGRIVVRPSGTQPLLRVMVETRSASETNNICVSLVKILKKELI